MSLLENLFWQGTVERLGWMLVHFLWQAAVVAAMLAVFLRLLRRTSASVRYLTACSGMALMVVLPVVTMQLVEVEGPAAESGPPAVTAPPSMEPLTPTEVQIVDEMPPFAEVASPLEIADLATPVSSWERIASVLRPALPYLVIAWLIGVFGLSAWHLGGWMQLQRLRRRMVRRVAPALLTRSRELALRLGVRRAVTLLESAIIEVPTVVGWLRPAILLPASALTGLSPEQLEAILAHELAHVRRYDYLVNLLQTLVEILGFYHPAVWWVSHRIRIERENCCDDLAVRLCGDSVQYARALTHLEEIRHRGTELAIAASGGSLIDRIARLLGRPATDERRFAWLPALIALLLVVSIVIPAALALATPDAPLATDAAAPESNASNQTPDAPTTEAISTVQAGEEQQSPVKILVKLSFFSKVSLNKVVDRETRLLIGKTLAAEDPQAVNEIAGIASQQSTTLGEVLRTWIVGRHFSPETIGMATDILQSGGYLEGESTPEVLANNNQQARMGVISDELFLSATDPASLPEPTKLGIFAQITPHVSSPASDRITLETTVEWRERIGQSDPNGTPTIRTTEMATTVTVPRNRCYTFLMEPGKAGTTQGTDSEAMLVLLSADHFEPRAKPESAPVQVLSKFVIAKVRANQRVDRQTAAEVARVLDWPLESVEGIPVGPLMQEVANTTSAEQFMDVVRLLESGGYVETLARPQVLTLAGQPAQVRIGGDPNAVVTGEDSFDLALGVVAQTPAGKQAIQLDVDVDLQLRTPVPTPPGWTGDPQDRPVSIRSVKSRVYLEPPNGKYVIQPLGGLTERSPTDPDSETLYLLASATTPRPPKQVDLPPGMGALRIEPQGAGTSPERSDSRAWTIMRQWNCPPLLLGLTQKLAKVLEPSRRHDPAWREVPGGGTLRLRIDVEGSVPGEVVVGLFKDARWAEEPVAVRRLNGAGVYTLTGLTPGQYQIGAMIGEVPVPLALGVHRTWPQPIEILQNQTTSAEVLVSEAFQKWASDGRYEEVAKDYLGQWDDLDETHLLYGQLTGPDGKPIPFGTVEIREHNPGARSTAIADQRTSEQGIYKCDEIDWPYQVTAVWREAIPSAFGYRRQRMYLRRVLEGPQRQDFRFEPFPQGAAKVTGRVVDQKGQPAKGFFVRVHIPPFSDLDPSNLTGGYKTQVTYDVPFISENGRFELSGLPAGRASVDIVPFEIQRYQRERGKDIVLEEGKPADVEFQFIGKAVFYGRVRFEDGTPAVIQPAPWQGAVTRILLPSGGRARGIAEVDADGYFTVYLDDSETEVLAMGDSQLVIDVPTDQERHWETAGHFPCEKLSDDKNKAGMVTVKRPDPTPVLPMHLRSDGPLPTDWQLDYQEWTGSLRRTTGVSLRARLAPSDSPDSRPPKQERFELYDCDGKRVQEFRTGSAMLLDEAQRYTLISRPEGVPADDWRILRGPFTLDLSRPGRYTLTGTLRPVTTEEDLFDATPRDDAPRPPVIGVESRFVLVDDAWMTALTSGLPIPGVTSLEDANALHAIGAGLSMDDAQPLNPDQTNLLLNAVRGHPGNRMLAAPRVSILNGEATSMSLSDRLNYISGYTEPNDPSQEPIPTHESQTVGLTCTITPTLIANGNAIRLDLTADIRSLLEVRELTYRDAYKYEAPVFKDIIIQSEMTLPDGWSALLLGDKITNLSSTQPADTPPRHLLVLLKATWTDPPSSPPAVSPSSIQEPADTRQARITAQFTNQSVLDALTEIAKRTGVKLYVDRTVQPIRVTVNLVDASAEAALHRVLEKTPYVFRRVPETEDAFQVFGLVTDNFEGADLR